jgi:hypothetical protein
MAKLSKNKQALEANEAALDKARADLAKAQKAVQTLSQKIPELETAVFALQVLCGEKPRAPKPTWTEVDPRVFETEPPQLVPGLEPAKDLDGIGSIPAPRESKPKPTTGNVAEQVKREAGFS